MEAAEVLVRATPHLARPHRRALVAEYLADLAGPATGMVQLPLHLFWSGDPGQSFDLDDEGVRQWVYETVLTGASRATDLTDLLDGVTLAAMWPGLFVPRGVRAAWEEAHPSLGYGRCLMNLDPLHREVARIALRAAARYGFALGGGNALTVHGIIQRPTMDVDLFTDREGGVTAAAGAVEAALRKAGYQADRADRSTGLEDMFEGLADGMADGLAEWEVTDTDGARMMLQLAYFCRTAKPVTTRIGPVLTLEDVLGGKVCALASRAEPRDYADTAAAMERFTVAQLIGFANRLDPGLGDEDFEDAGRRLDRVRDSWFRSLRLGPGAVAGIRRQFAVWPRG